jgi:hypothetical protein
MISPFQRLQLHSVTVVGLVKAGGRQVSGPRAGGAGTGVGGSVGLGVDRTVGAGVGVDAGVGVGVAVALPPAVCEGVAWAIPDVPRACAPWFALGDGDPAGGFDPASRGPSQRNSTTMTARLVRTAKRLNMNFIRSS